GLLYDRARWRRRRARNQAGATELLVRIDGADVPPAGRDNLWDERNIAMRAALKQRDYRTAYRLAAPHGLSSGTDFAEAEWAAGWISLRFLNQRDRAATHFETLRAGVSTAISASRADYWLGRAREAAGDADGARAAYELAAIHTTAYYGQLAAEKIGRRGILFPQTPVPTEEQRAEFVSRPLIRVLRLLGEAGERGQFRQFAYHIDDQLETPVDQLLLAEVANAYHIPDVGVRGGKAGLGKGIIAPEAAYPVVTYPLRRPANVENAFVLALSRQESELNPRAISHANARGLMQLIPATARTQARREGLPYRTSWLTDDPAYNMTLGATHLDDLISQFGGSYIMTAAAYNAGPRRPKQWIIDYGDPRRGEVDPIDWVELLPFSETRNYVQRILENTQVYRHRLAGQSVDIRLLEDLHRGRR
ncbi:MAG: lytic transglycosylase domain-containing protein, partial [Pseudomonadota bacterium]